MLALSLLFLLYLCLNKSVSDNYEDVELTKQLTSDRLQFNEMETGYIPIIDLSSELWPYAQLSLEDEVYNKKYKYPPKYSLNYLIGKKSEIEVILSENDIELTAQLADGFEKELSNSLIIPDKYYSFIKLFGDMNNDEYGYKYIHGETFTMNGATSDYRYKKKKRATTGMNGEYWNVGESCIQLKGCNVYPPMRVIHKSTIYTCQDIFKYLLPQIWNCIDKYGKSKCPLIINEGHFRVVFKVFDTKYNPNRYVVIKMMKQTSDERPRDLLRHVRESIFLHYARQEELKYIQTFGAKFTSFGEKRAFPFVHELGHCVYPTYMSVSHYFDKSLEDYIFSDLGPKTTLKRLIKMSLDMSRGIEILHNMPGGPYHHTDLRTDQFMIDDNDNILINDFNRGKFQTYLFSEDYNKYSDLDNNFIIKCNYCPHTSRGQTRAPEELISNSLDESVDIFSTAMVIWSLFACEEPWKTAKQSNDVAYLVSETARRPTMPHNMPYAIKDIIRAALSQNPKHRPNAKAFRQEIQKIYDNLSKYTRNKQNLTSEYIRTNKLFKDKSGPTVEEDFPEFIGKSGSG